jgi:two-component system sensor histidine kinase TctE
MAAPSLRGRLLAWLLVPLAAVLLANLLALYFFAWRPSRDAYDQGLANAALAIRQQLRFDEGRLALDLPNVAEQVLRTDEFDVIYVAVRDATGEYVAGDPSLAELAREAVTVDGKPTFGDLELHGKPVRVAILGVSTPMGEARVHVAETTVKRTLQRVEILTAALASTLALAAATLAIGWFGIRRGLAPLERIREAIAERSERDLRPVDLADVPREVTPLVAEINELLLRLDQAAGSQRRFIANAAHQLRTPLAGVLAQVEASVHDDPGSLRHAMGQIHLAAARTARLANQLLALARAEPGAVRPADFKPLDLARLLADEAEHWVTAGLERGIDVGFDLHPAPVSGDRLLLTELARNLVDNAFQYAGPGSTVTLRCGPGSPGDAGTVYLAVEDDGPGIAPAERERVLERFYRTGTAGGQGSGLGLAIVNEIALAHSGSVAIENADGARGTRVLISLPAASGRLRAPPERVEARQPLASGQGGP